MTLMSTLRRRLLVAAAIASLGLTQAAQAADGSAPDQLIRGLSIEVLETVKSDKDIQAGNVGKIVALVDAKVMPHVNFQRMTASAVGRFWRQATPDQQAKLQAEFKTLLVRTYAGALTQVKDQQIGLKRFTGQPTDTEVVVKTEIRGKGDPIQLDYRLEKTGAVWKIYDVNVLGIWLADQYRNSFAQEIGANGIDGLIKSLADKNAKAGAAKG
ncbi:MlaC/ttg2D family ABC transporter substrate-binding protein [Roseateles sp. LKC17W]|uniref:Phospholipid-binding protein MlaC n=1 Tax=Pelomonas margarita TaxID=3299031 RepID=A0ABW7FJQ5_9BURK